MTQLAETQFELNKFTEPTYNYSYSYVGVPPGGFPTIRDGLSTLSIDVGTERQNTIYCWQQRLRRTV